MFGAELLLVVKSCDIKWATGTQYGKPVKVTFSAISRAIAPLAGWGLTLVACNALLFNLLAQRTGNKNRPVRCANNVTIRPLSTT